jgi:hypothetical protein
MDGGLTCEKLQRMWPLMRIGEKEVKKSEGKKKRWRDEARCCTRRWRPGAVGGGKSHREDVSVDTTVGRRTAASTSKKEAAKENMAAEEKTHLPND